MMVAKVYKRDGTVEVIEFCSVCKTPVRIIFGQKVCKCS